MNKEFLCIHLLVRNHTLYFLIAMLYYKGAPPIPSPRGIWKLCCVSNSGVHFRQQWTNKYSLQKCFVSNTDAVSISTVRLSHKIQQAFELPLSLCMNCTDIDTDPLSVTVVNVAQSSYPKVLEMVKYFIYNLYIKNIFYNTVFFSHKFRLGQLATFNCP